MTPFLPPDHSKGDERTIGGYAAVHGRPAAFQGVDGLAYSVEIEVDDTGERDAPFGAYLLFVRWSPGSPSASGHLESDFLARADSAEKARETVGALSLSAVKTLLDTLIGAQGPRSSRPWWEAMNDDDESEGR